MAAAGRREQAIMNNSSQAVAERDLRLTLIRGFEFRSGDSVVPMVFSAQRLVAFVALRDRAVRRPHASGTLWTDVPERQANSSLRSALWRAPAPGGQQLVEASGTHLWLNPAVHVDFRDIVSRAEMVLDHADGLERAGNLRDQLRLLGDDLLPDWYDDWVLADRERYRQLRLRTLETMCHRLTDLGQYALALEAGLAAVACEPLRESAQREVVRVHLTEGNTVEAVRQYRSYARLLDDEIGVRPSPSMDKLIDETHDGLSRRLGDGGVTANA
ncbi:MAG: AfsR/SARP family transcriptional regulator [Streptosporangiaceae bacterium]